MSEPPEKSQHAQIENPMSNQGVQGQTIGEVHITHSHTHITQNLPDPQAPYTDAYLLGRGPEAYRGITTPIEEAADNTIRGEETIDNLRAKLLRGAGAKLKKPKQITVTGILYPCALLTNGWWDRSFRLDVQQVKWRNDIQEWLFHGFDLWGPSWDFSWNLDHWEQSSTRQHFISQLGNGDEANSLPVVIPNSKAQRLREIMGNWHGMQVKITCLLTHSKFLKKKLDATDLAISSGPLDYYLWIDENNKKHQIQPIDTRVDVYSGYLWKCVASQEWLADQKPSLRDVYFIWEHTNLASKEALAYGLEALEKKERYIEDNFSNKLVLVQKSSSVVPGEPLLTPEEVYAMFARKSLPAI